MLKHFKTRFPAANVPHWNDTVATDTFFSDVPAHDDGIKSHGGTTMVQLYTGVHSLLTEIFPMKVASDMVGTLEDLIRKREHQILSGVTMPRNRPVRPLMKSSACIALVTSNVNLTISIRIQLKDAFKRSRSSVTKLWTKRVLPVKCGYYAYFM
jgi:hypothetical protein